MMVSYFVAWTATDIWPLLFGFAAVLAAMRRWPVLAGIFLGLGLACKIVPAVLFMLLLPVTRSWRAFVSCALASAALLLPWLAWDPLGFLGNFVFWGLTMAPDSNSWVYFAPAWLVWPVRVLLIAAIAFLALRLSLRRAGQVCLGFCALTLLVMAGGGSLHNNYLPWMTVWFMLAIAETLLIPGAVSAGIAGGTHGAKTNRNRTGPTFANSS